WRELQRRIEGLSGRVPMRWTVEPRFDHGRRTTRLSTRPGFAVARLGADALAVRSWDAGEVTCDRGGIAAGFETRPGSRGLVALCFSHQEPLVLPTRDECEARLDRTVAVWRRWLSSRTTDGPWSSAVARSALALKLLVFAPSGAVAAAATTSLPEWVGGERNWDYRFSWVRDSAFTLASLLHLGSVEEARGGEGLLLVAAARHRVDPSAAEGALPARRLGPRPGADAAAGRLPRVPAGAARQRRGGPGSAGHLRRAAADRVGVRFGDRAA